MSRDTFVTEVTDNNRTADFVTCGAHPTFDLRQVLDDLSENLARLGILVVHA